MNKKALYIDISIRILFVALYTYTATMKWLDFAVYRIKMRRQHIPGPLKEGFVYGVPIVELLVAIALLLPYLVAIPKLSRLSLQANLVLIGSFTAYSGLAASGIFGYVPCACGGFLEGMGWWVHFLLNLALTIVAAIGVWLHRSNSGAEVFTSVRG